MKQQILFVDDENNLLQGLKRMLRPMKGRWDMEFALGGRAALAEMQHRCFDVLVTDMKMPDVDGAALLKEAREVCPFTVRMVLSGQADEAGILGSVRFSHQYLSKPCDRERIHHKINKACLTREMLKEQSIKELVSQLSSLVVVPNHYQQLKLALEQEQPDLKNITKIVSQDVGLSAKVLQLTNSDYFGRGEALADVSSAVERLGVTALRMLGLRSNIFRPLEKQLPGLQLDRLTQHSFEVAHTAVKIAQLEGLDDLQQAQAFTAGMLHEIGRVILVSELPEEYRNVVQLVSDEGISFFEAEVQTFGSSHCEIGAYLLSLWGLSESIIEAVAFQHHPQSSSSSDFGILSIVHAANALQDELRPRRLDETRVLLDEAYIGEVDKKEKVSAWRNAAIKDDKGKGE